MTDLGRVITIRIPLDGQTSGEKEDGGYTFGFQFSPGQGKRGYANGVKKWERMVFYVKDHDNRLMVHHLISNIHRHDHCVISTRNNKQVPESFQQATHQIVIYFV